MIGDICNFLCVFLNERDNANLGFNEESKLGQQSNSFLQNG